MWLKTAVAEMSRLLKNIHIINRPNDFDRIVKWNKCMTVTSLFSRRQGVKSPSSLILHTRLVRGADDFKTDRKSVCFSSYKFGMYLSAK